MKYAISHCNQTDCIELAAAGRYHQPVTLLFIYVFIRQKRDLDVKHLIYVYICNMVNEFRTSVKKDYS